MKKIEKIMYGGDDIAGMDSAIVTAIDKINELIDAHNSQVKEPERSLIIPFMECGCLFHVAGVKCPKED